jgi:hypothetical protein
LQEKPVLRGGDSTVIAAPCKITLSGDPRRFSLDLQKTFRRWGNMNKKLKIASVCLT